ncbi:MAG: hypothetical protein AAGC56_06280 [Pseudomonadota bacterium]
MFGRKKKRKRASGLEALGGLVAVAGVTLIAWAHVGAHVEAHVGAGVAPARGGDFAAADARPITFAAEHDGVFCDFSLL